MILGSRENPADALGVVLEYVELCDAGALITPLVFGGMPEDEARPSYELFTSEVLPELRRHDVGGASASPTTPAGERLPSLGREIWCADRNEGEDDGEA